MSNPPTLRERRRADTVAQIKQAALAQIRDEGAPSLSIRALARATGLSPAGMYRYYDSRDALLTDLLTDAYRDLADAVAAAAAGEAAATGRAGEPRPTDRLRSAILAYRSWAVADPHRFMLIFGTPVPGYAAPADGPTVEQSRRMGSVLFELTAQAWSAGELSMPPPSAPLGPAEAGLLATIRQGCPDFPTGLVPVMIAGWALWHGLVTLEVTNQLHWIYPDAADYFAACIDQWLDRLRSPDPAAGAPDFG